MCNSIQLEAVCVQFSWNPMFMPVCSSSLSCFDSIRNAEVVFCTQKVCYLIIKQMPKFRLRNDWSTSSCRVYDSHRFQKSGRFLWYRLRAWLSRANKKHPKVFTNDAIYITYCQHNAAHWRQTYCTMAQVPHTSNVNYYFKRCLYARWIMASQKEETSFIVRPLFVAAVPNEFIFRYLSKIIFKLQLMAEHAAIS